MVAGPKRRRADAGRWVSLSDGGEQLKVRDAGTNEVTGQQLVREAEEFVGAEKSSVAKVAESFSAWHVYIYTPEGCATIQRAFQRLEKKASRNLMKFNNGKCKVLHLRKNSPRHQYMQGDTQLEGSLAREGSEGSARYQADHDPAICPHSKQGKQPPGLH